MDIVVGMRPLVSLLFVTACTTSPASNDAPKCASFAVSQDITCNADMSSCSWRGQACRIDDCGLPPAYPGYAASPQDDGTVKILQPQWNALTAWVDAERNFQFCEASL